MHTHHATTTQAPTGPIHAAAEPAIRRNLRGAVLGTATAVAATSCAYAVGNIGADIQVVTGWAPDGADLRYGEVVATVTVAILAGAGLLTVLERRLASAFRTWSTLAVSAAVLSALPLWRLEVDAGSKVWLTVMHLATGACAIAAQRRVRRGGGVLRG